MSKFERVVYFEMPDRGHMAWSIREPMFCFEREDLGELKALVADTMLSYGNLLANEDGTFTSMDGETVT